MNKTEIELLKEIRDEIKLSRKWMMALYCQNYSEDYRFFHTGMEITTALKNAENILEFGDKNRSRDQH